MGIKQHNGNTKADRLAELKIRSPSIQLIKFGAIGLNAIIFSPLLIAADTGSQYGTNITINDGDIITQVDIARRVSCWGHYTIEVS